MFRKVGQRGSTMVEYALILAGVFTAFVAIAAALHWLSNDRTNRSMNVVEDAAPCESGGGPTGLHGSECL